LATPLDW